MAVDLKLAYERVEIETGKNIAIVTPFLVERSRRWAALG